MTPRPRPPPPPQVRLRRTWQSRTGRRDSARSRRGGAAAAASAVPASESLNASESPGRGTARKCAGPGPVGPDARHYSCDSGPRRLRPRPRRRAAAAVRAGGGVAAPGRPGPGGIRRSGRLRLRVTSPSPSPLNQADSESRLRLPANQGHGLGRRLTGRLDRHSYPAGAGGGRGGPAARVMPSCHHDD